MDFDDTLIVDGKVNTELIGFLYQARNKGKRIVLLSRHDTELLPDLERFAVSPALFDEIMPPASFCLHSPVFGGIII